MFSWSKKKESKRRGRDDRDSEENEFGIKLDKGPDDKQLEAELKRLAGVDSFPEDDLNLNEGEDDVEAELLRLVGGGRGKRPPKKPANKSTDEPLGDISDLTAEIDLGDEDVEVDENDEELLGELMELTNPEEALDGLEDEVESDKEPKGQPASGENDIVSTLRERLKMYKTAEAKAKGNNESSRARRFSRGIKALEDLLKKAKAGKAVPPDDIPPPIAFNLKPPPPPPPEPDVHGDLGEVSEEFEDSQLNSTEVEETKAVSEPEDIMKTLYDRLKLYQTAESKAKENGETSRARRFGRGIKTLKDLIKQAQAGKPIAPGDIPPEVPLNLKPSPPPLPPPDEDESAEGIEDEIGTVSLTNTEEPLEEEKSIIDVLTERLQLYKTAETKAKESGETSKVRRFGRGIKTLQDLIKQATAGKPIAQDDIPPAVALNLKQAPVVPMSEEELQQPSVERVDLVKSSHGSGKPLAFSANDIEVDVDEELSEETPTTVLEGLEQRVRLYSKFQEEARKEGDMAMAEQNERIVRVYMNAIRSFKNGGCVDVLKLPNPKGCPPIPIPFYVP